MSAAFISEEEAREQVKDLMAPKPKKKLVEGLMAPKPKKKTIRFKARVPAHLGKGGKPRDAIVTIDKALTMRIRPVRGRSKQAYELSMEQAVAWLMQKLRVPDSIGKPRRRRL